MTEPPDPMQQRWYAHPNDVIGGWSVNNVDKPVSLHDWAAGERDVADFIEEPFARHIAHLHNVWLGYEEEA